MIEHMLIGIFTIFKLSVQVQEFGIQGSRVKKFLLNTPTYAILYVGFILIEFYLLKTSRPNSSLDAIVQISDSSQKFFKYSAYTIVAAGIFSILWEHLYSNGTKTKNSDNIIKHFYRLLALELGIIIIALLLITLDVIHFSGFIWLLIFKCGSDILAHTIFHRSTKSQTD